jgi:hypothetical protein
MKGQPVRTLSFAVVVALATAARAQQPFDESDFRGVHDVTGLLVLRRLELPGPCALPTDQLRTDPGGHKDLVFHRVCTSAELRYRLRTLEQFMRQKLGDPGRH